MIEGQVRGLDLFDSPVTLFRFLYELVESYALDAIDSKGTTGPEISHQEIERFLDEASDTPIERFSCVGEGEDLRLQGERLTGGALVADDWVIHLCVFPVPETRAMDREQRSRMARASR